MHVHVYYYVQRKQADVFVLDTDEQDLTHHGRSIRDMERFDDINITDDETEEGTHTNLMIMESVVNIKKQYS